MTDTTSPRSLGLYSPAEDDVLTLDSRPLSPLVFQEIVLLANQAWLIWLSGEGEILSAQKGALA